MENLLQVLKEATLFILTTQLFRHLLPGKKYLPYENVILSMAVLSMLIVPIEIVPAVERVNEATIDLVAL